MQGGRRRSPEQHGRFYQPTSRFEIAGSYTLLQNCTVERLVGTCGRFCDLTLISWPRLEPNVVQNPLSAKLNGHVISIREVRWQNPRG